MGALLLPPASSAAVEDRLTEVLADRQASLTGSPADQRGDDDDSDGTVDRPLGVARGVVEGVEHDVDGHVGEQTADREHRATPP